MVRILIFCLFLVSCQWTHPSKDTENPYDAAKSKREVYLELIDDVYSLVDRCDAVTFVGLFDRYGKRIGLYEHYYDAHWHRDVEPCYPDDSRSEISTESMLGVLHALWGRGDRESIADIRNFGDENDWRMADGPDEYVRLLHLRPLITWMLDSPELKTFEIDPWSVIGGYRANVIADYIALKGDVLGSINKIELDALEVMVKNQPESPIYQALWHRYTDGDQARALEILNNENLFPLDSLPERGLDAFDWGGRAPSAILWLFAFGIIDNES